MLHPHIRSATFVRIRTSRPRYFKMYAAANTAEAAICDICMATVQFRTEILGALSGTMIASPGFKTVCIGLPDHQPELFFAAITEPSARITNAACRLDSCVNPPA